MRRSSLRSESRCRTHLHAGNTRGHRTADRQTSGARGRGARLGRPWLATDPTASGWPAFWLQSWEPRHWQLRFERLQTAQRTQTVRRTEFARMELARARGLRAVTTLMIDLPGDVLLDVPHVRTTFLTTAASLLGDSDHSRTTAPLLAGRAGWGLHMDRYWEPRVSS